MLSDKEGVIQHFHLDVQPRCTLYAAGIMLEALLSYSGLEGELSQREEVHGVLRYGMQIFLLKCRNGRLELVMSEDIGPVINACEGSP